MQSIQPNKNHSLLVKAIASHEYKGIHHRLVVDGALGRKESPWSPVSTMVSLEYGGTRYGATCGGEPNIFQIESHTVHRCSYVYRPASGAATARVQCPVVLIGGYFCPTHADEMMKRARRSTELMEARHYLQTLSEDEILALLEEEGLLKSALLGVE
jgi:hypothetical protein